MKEEINFRAELKFEGPISEFEKLIAGISELRASGLMIGTWPTPEKPFPGIWPIAKFVSREILDKIIEGMPRVEVIKDIYGGIRNPHLHIDNKVVLLNKEKFKDLVGQVAMELARNLADRLDYNETIGAIRHLAPDVK